ncbi:MAG: hypothetical protein V4460_10540 [Pseudomonadota bacterium]
MTQAVAAALAGQARVVIAADAAALVDLRHTISDSRGDGGSVLLVIAETVPKLDRALLIAAIGPIAMDAAPAMRVAALDLADGACADDVLAAARFLAAATSSTGQVLRIGARD